MSKSFTILGKALFWSWKWNLPRISSTDIHWEYVHILLHSSNLHWHLVTLQKCLQYTVRTRRGLMFTYDVMLLVGVLLTPICHAKPCFIWPPPPPPHRRPPPTPPFFWFKINHATPPQKIVPVLLSASIERFFVSRMLDFFCILFIQFCRKNVGFPLFRLISEYFVFSSDFVFLNLKFCHSKPRPTTLWSYLTY